MSYTKPNALFKSIDAPSISKKLFAHIEGQKYSYGQLSENLRKLQQYFTKIGLNKGDRVILSSESDYNTSLLFLAFLRCGITTVLIDPTIPPTRAIALIEKAEAKAFAMDSSLLADRAIDEANQICIKIEKSSQKKGKLFNRLLKNKASKQKANTDTFPAILDNLIPSNEAPASIDGDDAAYVLFTSGTTSEPKGVILSYENLFSHLATLTKVFNLNEESNILNILMLYHTDGIIQGPLLSLFNHASWIRPFQFDVSKIQELFFSVYKYKITHFITVPTILSFLDKFSDNMEDSFQTDDFKCIVSVASTLEEKLWIGFEEKFQVQIVNVYGLTESVTGSLFCGINDFPRKIATVGVPIDCEAKIITENGKEAQFNEAGELYLKGKHIFKGYFNQQEATDAVLKDGWLHTGDIASKDEEGFYTITGRSKNTISFGGINIYPEQISEMINKHPAVWDNICVGLPDESFGEKLVAAIQLKDDQSLDKMTLIEFLRALLEQNHIPKEFYFLDELPRGLSGKIQIQKVKEMLKEHENNDTHSNNDSYQSAIKKAASEAFGIPSDHIQMKDTSNTLEGWDSMAHLVFVTELEKHFDIRFTTAEIITMNSIKATESILLQKLEL